MDIKMKICCISDLHGHFPEIPDCDLLLIGGDIVPLDCHDPENASKWMSKVLKPWINNLSERMKIVVCSGNHDFIWESNPELIPQMNWTYLQDSGTEFEGLKVYGSPHQPYFGGWAFNLYEPELKEKWALIPDDTDILLLHGPPYMYGDFSSYGNEHTGSPSLLTRIEEIKPKLSVAGHIHSGRGIYNIGPTIFVNAALVDENYKLVNESILVEI